MQSVPPFTIYPDLAAETTIPERGIHSQTLSNDGGIELVLFAMAAGERLSEHTSSRAAIVHILQGNGELVVEGASHAFSPGYWLRMGPRTRHAILARSGVVFALYLLPER